MEKPMTSEQQRARNDAAMLEKIKDLPPERFKELRAGIERDGYAAVQSLTK